CCEWWSCECFFFEEEGGIGDWSVIGVQRCALPISRPGFTPGPPAAVGSYPAPTGSDYGSSAQSYAQKGHAGSFAAAAETYVGARSEERRGGKEGRRAGFADELKKKSKCYGGQICAG